ncbi:galactocerebrosidase-like [Mytilus trossulus]|uniref:galactocerebrosidase-like n=1 Tax=Mytilus trossulus TaxID=6551 RepID=UPI0030063096
MFSKLFMFILFSYCHSQIITYEVDDSQGLGRRFDGIGAISGGGATSLLVRHYPTKLRDEILDYLFKPNFGASLQILKVEIGGDSQSGEGSEASHMHNSWDENYYRGYEWWMMKEAKKRNPDILLYGLPWGWPGWIGNGTHNPYYNVNTTAVYIIKWIQGAKKHHDLDINFVGIWNELAYSIEYIKTLRRLLDQNGFHDVKIVAVDGGFEIINDMLKDPELSDAIEYIGVHYPGTQSTVAAHKTGKQLWSSEDFSTFNDNIGAGCWARTLNQNYVNGLFTGTIAWNMISGYYNALPFICQSLMTANSPWSGNYVINNPIWVTAHTTQFTAPGWRYLKHNSGVGKLTKGGSYVSLVSHDGKNLTIIMETMTSLHSVCFYQQPKFNVTLQTITLQLKGSFAKIDKMALWYSRLGYDGGQTEMMKYSGPVDVRDGQINLNLYPDMVVTLTTLTTGQKGSHQNPPQDKPFPFPYTENFEEYNETDQPKYMAQQLGCFEVHKSTDGNHGNVLRQMVLEQPVYWTAADRLKRTANLVGDYSWEDITVSIDAKTGEINGTTGVFLAARVDRGGVKTGGALGVFFYLYPSLQMYKLTSDIGGKSVLKFGAAHMATKGWNTLKLILQGYQVEGYLNGQYLFESDIQNVPLTGFVGFGTSYYGYADYDNLAIYNSEKVTPRKDPEVLYFVPRH